MGSKRVCPKEERGEGTSCVSLNRPSAVGLECRNAASGTLLLSVCPWGQLACLEPPLVMGAYSR